MVERKPGFKQYNLLNPCLVGGIVSIEGAVGILRIVGIKSVSESR